MNVYCRDFVQLLTGSEFLSWNAFRRAFFALVSLKAELHLEGVKVALKDDALRVCLYGV